MHKTVIKKTNFSPLRDINLFDKKIMPKQQSEYYLVQVVIQKLQSKHNIKLIFNIEFSPSSEDSGIFYFPPAFSPTPHVLFSTTTNIKAIVNIRLRPRCAIAPLTLYTSLT